MAVKKKNNSTTLVRIETAIVDKVKLHTDKTKQSVGGFFSIAATELLVKESKK